MKVPSDLNAWTYETILEIVRSSTLEPYEYDFKATVDPKGEDADSIRSNIRKCACAMANSDGGYIIFGVSNRGDVNKPEERIVGIEAGQDWSSRFDNHAKQVRPQIPFTFTTNPILLPNDKSKCVFVVQIPQSPRRPHECDGRFFRRNHGGSAEHMSAMEVRDLMLLTEGRLSKLTLLRIELQQLESVARYIASEKQPWTCSYRFETGAIQPLLAETCPLFPPGNELLREVIRVVSFARKANQILDMSGEHVWPDGSSPANTLKNDLDQARFAVEHTCKKVEDALRELHGPIRP